MRKVAVLEGAPWIPTSNTEYFGRFNGNQGGTLMYNGKQLYGLGLHGQERALPIVARYGKEPGQKA